MTFPRSNIYKVEGLDRPFKIIGVKPSSTQPPGAAMRVYDSCQYDDPGLEGWNVQYEGWYFYNGILRSKEEVVAFCMFAANLYKQGLKDQQFKIQTVLGIR